MYSYGYRVFAAIVSSTFIAAIQELWVTRTNEGLVSAHPRVPIDGDKSARRTVGFEPLQRCPKLCPELLFLFVRRFFTPSVPNNKVEKGSRVRSTPSDYQESWGNVVHCKTCEAPRFRDPQLATCIAVAVGCATVSALRLLQRRALRFREVRLSQASLFLLASTSFGCSVRSLAVATIIVFRCCSRSFLPSQVRDLVPHRDLCFRLFLLSCAVTPSVPVSRTVSSGGLREVLVAAPLPRRHEAPP